MPSYVFRVGTPDGDVVEREVKAPSLARAREDVSRQGFHIFKVTRRGLDFSSLSAFRKVVTIDQFLVFNQQLLALVRAGLPIVQSFEIMLERQKNLRFKAVLTEIRDKIKSGVALSDAFASFGSLFPPIYSTSIRAGERSGDLEGVLKRFLRYQKMISALRKKVTTAMIYPTVLMIMMVVMIVVMMTSVIPKFSEFFEGLGAELPAMTRIMIRLSLSVRNNFLLGVGLIIAVVVLQKLWLRTESGRALFDRIKLKIPVVGPVLHRFAILQFTQSLGTLLSGGTPMVPSIEIASESIGNRHVGARVASIAQRVREGEPLWKSLEATGVMSDLAIEMIKVGESSGSLVEMLANASEFYDEEIEEQLARLMALIEPVILVILGGVIGLLLYAFYLPLFELAGKQGTE